MKNRNNNLIVGLALIVFAVCLVMDRMVMFPGLPLIKIGAALLLAVIFLKSVRKVEFMGMVLSLGAAAWLFQDELGLQSVPGYIIIIAAILIGIGLSMIFGKKDYCQVHISDSGSSNGASYSEGEGTFDVDNNLGSKTEYVQVKNIRRGKIDNALGQLTVYLNGSTIDPEGAFIDIDNGLGNLAVFIPKEFRVKFNTDNGLGKINFHGECSRDESQPLVNVKLDNGLGSVEIYFD